MTFEDIREADLEGTSIQIAAGEDVKRLVIGKQLGAGAKGVTWRAKDRLGTDVAIKIVSSSDYHDHSIEEEIRLVRLLPTRFAHIYDYGRPTTKVGSLDLGATYVLVQEWVDGEPLAKFVARTDLTIDAKHFLEFASQLCEVLAALEQHELTHNDLHPENILVAASRHGPSLAAEFELRVVDTGSLKTKSRRSTLLESWRTELQTLQDYNPSKQARARIELLRAWVTWASRSDQEWIVSHLILLLNCSRTHAHRLKSTDRKFFDGVAPILDRMLDENYSMRLDRPRDMYEQLDLLYRTVNAPPQAGLASPFDYISAELIRNDRRLNELFSSECPWFQQCRSTGPIYIYGPRGCGKSTILRMLSLSALLTGPDPQRAFADAPYIGVYLSCSSELRSRFWLFPETSYREIAADAITYFTMLLAEALLETLESLQDGQIEPLLGQSVGLTSDSARSICQIIFQRFKLDGEVVKLSGSSWIAFARRKLTTARNNLWAKLLTSPTKSLPNPSLIFDIIKDMEGVFPLLKTKHVAFLIDDYSNQRIPAPLQRMLNQTISFAKQGNPIFKVTSEYQGVDLEGIQEGREVIEVNIGREYVSLDEQFRASFLESVLNIRFKAAGIDKKIHEILGRSRISPGIPMARAIRRAHEGGEHFYYWGIDTVADICSGDLAMALDLIKQIYAPHSSSDFRLPVPPSEQHEHIRRYASREHHYLRYHYEVGEKMASVVEWLCWISHESAVACDSTKDGKPEPMVKTGIDMRISARNSLDKNQKKILNELIRRGVLFSLDTSRTRYDSDSTERFQVRRILLAKSEAPLGRRDPIKIDSDQRLIFLLTDPEQFAKSEVKDSSSYPKLL